MAKRWENGSKGCSPPLGRCGAIVVVAVAVTGGDAFSTTESLIDRFYFLIAKVSRAETTFLPAPRFLFPLSSSFSSSSRRKEIPRPLD